VHRERTRGGPGFILWLAVTTLGLAWAGWFGHFPFGFPPGLATPAPRAALIWAGFGAASAVAVAVGQWLVLRRSLGVRGSWVPATVLGVAALHALGDSVAESGRVGLVSAELAAVALVGGATTGALQFLALRRRLDRAAWWIAASAAGWGIGVTAGLAAVAALGLGSGRDAHAVAGGTAGVIVGASTGLVLARMARQTAEINKPQAQPHPSDQP
jgi:hypothetical protein